MKELCKKDEEKRKSGDVMLKLSIKCCGANPSRRVHLILDWKCMQFKVPPCSTNSFHVNFYLQMRNRQQNEQLKSIEMK